MWPVVYLDQCAARHQHKGRVMSYRSAEKTCFRHFWKTSTETIQYPFRCTLHEEGIFSAFIFWQNKVKFSSFWFTQLTCGCGVIHCALQVHLCLGLWQSSRWEKKKMHWKYSTWHVHLNRCGSVLIWRLLKLKSNTGSAGTLCHMLLFLTVSMHPNLLRATHWPPTAPHLVTQTIPKWYSRTLAALEV